MTLAKVKEQDGIMLANVNVPSIPTSAACSNDLQQVRSPLTIPLSQLLHRTLMSSKAQLPLALQLSITSLDCVLLQAADVGILWTLTFASIIPSCSFTFASIIPFCSFITFASTDKWQLSLINFLVAEH